MTFPAGHQNLVDATGNPFSASNPLPTSSGAPAAANVLAGFLSHVVTTAAVTLLTVPAGRTWAGSVVVATTVANAAANAVAGQARGVVATAGVGVTPAAGTVLACESRAGANAATGTVGSQESRSVSLALVVVAPAGNAVTLTLASTIAGTNGTVDASASGQLI